MDSAIIYAVGSKESLRPKVYRNPRSESQREPSSLPSIMKAPNQKEAA